MSPPWSPHDPRWGWCFLGGCIVLAAAIMFGGYVFGQGDPRPTVQTMPIMGIDSANRLILVGDYANHALRVSVVQGGSSSVTVISSALPAGASTDASVQNVEAAIRNVQADYGATFPVAGASVAAVDPSGFTASLSVSNTGALEVTCDNCTAAPPTAYAAAMPANGAAIGFKDGGGMLASATVDNAGNIFVIASQSSSSWTVNATGTITAHQGDTWSVSCTNCSGASTTNFGSTFSTSGLAIGAKDGAGRFASLTVDNASNLFVIASQSTSAWTVIATGTITAHQGDTWTVNCSNCSGASTTNFGATFPAAGTALGVKDGAGRFASMTVDNASNLFVIASQSSSPWTVNATGTITAHQGDTWTVACSNCSGASTTNFGATFPSSGSAVGFKDGAGSFASATVDNAGFLLVTASQGNANAIPWNVAATGTITAHQGDVWTVGINTWLGSTTPTVGQKTMAASLPVVIASDQTPVAATGTITAHQGDAWTVSSTQGTSPWVVSGTVTANTTPNATISLAYPSAVYANFKDGAGKVASAAVDNASNLFVIASQGTANSAQPWFATGTITAHQGDTWTVGLSTGSNIIGALTANQSVNLAQVGGTTTVNGGTVGLLGVGGPTATGSQASGNPVRMGAVARPTNKPTVTDGNMVDLSTTSTGDLYVRADTSAATGTIAPARVQVMGGWGKSAVATAVTVCDQYATVSLINGGNTQVITGVAGQQIHICAMTLITASATAVGIFEGSGTLCNTNKLGLIGSHSTANGVNLATTGGFTIGSGMGEVITTQQAGVNICLGNSTTAVVSGGIKWTSY